MPEQLTQDLCLHFVILERKGEKNLKDVENDRVGPFLRFHSLQEIFQNGTFTILFMAKYQNEKKNLNFILTSEASLFKNPTINFDAFFGMFGISRGFLTSDA